MIKALYETHLQVKSLEDSIKFYELLGLNLLSKSGNRVAFMKIGEKDGKYQELGLWQVNEGQEVVTRHFAFEVELEDLLKAKEWLFAKGIETIGRFGHTNSEPVVHTSGPLASIYFNDPDENELEFASRVPGTPTKLDYVPTLSEWYAINSLK